MCQLVTEELTSGGLIDRRIDGVTVDTARLDVLAARADAEKPSLGLVDLRAQRLAAARGHQIRRCTRLTAAAREKVSDSQVQGSQRAVELKFFLDLFIHFINFWICIYHTFTELTRWHMARRPRHTAASCSSAWELGERGGRGVGATLFSESEEPYHIYVPLARCACTRRDNRCAAVSVEC